MARSYFLKKGRLVKISAVCFILLPLFYLFFTSNISSVQLEKVKPKLVSRLGNYEPKNVEERKGPGENGEPHILNQNRQSDAEESESEYGMNIACSDEISLDRSIPDTRLSQCRHWYYPGNLPNTTVIIVFHNEGLSVLLRTVHSVINRSPKRVLQEVLLVDDFSDKDDLKGNLKNHIKQYNGLVRLIRNKRREGLIRTRSRGALEARGEVIVFLDAHCEVNINWLPPLLAPINRDATILTVPIIDGIDQLTFQYRPVYAEDRHYRGIFEWGLLYKENEVPQRELATRQHNSEPYKSPTHAGGLFAINRLYFLKLGAYDSGLLVWGGENFELSFKVWQCGGSIEWVPCSRVGHVYRNFMPYSFGMLARKKKGPLITINYKRVVETWFDEKYKELFYTREPHARFLDVGDLSQQLKLKKQLRCKSFDWYMKNIAYDVFDKFPEPPPNLHWGELRSGATSKCVDTLGHSPPSLITIQYCHSLGNNQLVRFNAKGQLSVGERCIEADSQGIKLTYCQLGTVDGPWIYDENFFTFLHRVHKRCMALHPLTSHLSLLPCDANNSYQQWHFKEVRPRW